VINPPDSLEQGQEVKIAGSQPGEQQEENVRQPENAPEKRQDQQKGKER
jgi:hypothetical protein